MSTFEVVAKKVIIEDHPDADSLEIARVDGYQCVVGKGQFHPGQEVVYIPEQAILPEWLITEMGLEGRLAGPDKNRVKAIKLRGIVSQGLLYDLQKNLSTPLEPGVDYSNVLDIEKYHPPIPIEMSGQVYECEGMRSYTDIENLKKFPNTFLAGEPVVATEKIHGTCCIFMYDLKEERLHVSSKGMAAKGLALEENASNVYWRAANDYGVKEMMPSMAFGLSQHVFLFGEVFGVQDLKYGKSKGHTGFRAFDISNGYHYLDYNDFNIVTAHWELPKVPVLYTGEYSDEMVYVHTLGMEQVSGAEEHIREGIVIRPLRERHDSNGRVIRKSVSADYLLRKNKDATEYE